METSEWLQNHSIKLLSNPKCTFPKAAKSQFIKKIKIGVHIECGNNAEVEEKISVKIRPAEDQIVFEGDPLRLNCIATGRFELIKYLKSIWWIIVFQKLISCINKLQVYED